MRGKDKKPYRRGKVGRGAAWGRADGSPLMDSWERKLRESDEWGKEVKGSWVPVLITMASLFVIAFVIPFEFIWNQPWWGAVLFVLAIAGLIAGDRS